VIEMGWELPLFMLVIALVSSRRGSAPAAGGYQPAAASDPLGAMMLGGLGGLSGASQAVPIPSSGAAPWTGTPVVPQIGQPASGTMGGMSAADQLVQQALAQAQGAVGQFGQAMQAGVNQMTGVGQQGMQDLSQLGQQGMQDLSQLGQQGMQWLPQLGQMGQTGMTDLSQMLGQMNPFGGAPSYPSFGGGGGSPSGGYPGGTGPGGLTPPSQTWWNPQTNTAGGSTASGAGATMTPMGGPIGTPGYQTPSGAAANMTPIGGPTPPSLGPYGVPVGQMPPNPYGGA
jgi:hypothetical protein